VERVLAGGAVGQPAGAGAPSRVVEPVETTQPGGVYVAPTVAQPNDFVRGLLVGGAVALAGAVVGGWIAGRRR
jgi:hypothetical protein